MCSSYTCYCTTDNKHLKKLPLTQYYKSYVPINRLVWTQNADNTINVQVAPEYMYYKYSEQIT